LSLPRSDALGTFSAKWHIYLDSVDTQCGSTDIMLETLCEIQKAYPPTELADPAHNIMYTLDTEDTKCSEYTKCIYG